MQYACMVITFIADYGSSGYKVANPARGQLNRENEHFPFLVRDLEFGLARQVRPRPASAGTFNMPTSYQ